MWVLLQDSSHPAAKLSGDFTAYSQGNMVFSQSDSKKGTQGSHVYWHKTTDAQVCLVYKEDNSFKLLTQKC